MQTSEKQIMKEVLGRMGDDVPGPVPFEELDSVELRLRDPGLDRWTLGRNIGFAAATAVVVLVLVGGVAVLRNSQSNAIYVGEGETLISPNPPIVQGQAAPEPSFDTSGLGDEKPLTQINDGSRISREIDLQFEYASEEIIRITALGETPEGVLAYVVHSVGDDADLGRLQRRCLTTSLGEAVCVGVEAASLIDLPGGLLPGPVIDGPSFSSGTGRTETSVTWEVPSATSVVALTVNGETSWQQPVADIAVFVTELMYGDEFELVAYDADGNVLDSVALTSSPDA